MQPSLTYLIVLAVVLLICSLVLLVALFRNMSNRHAELTLRLSGAVDQMTESESKIKALEEQISVRRHTENTVAALEDALALLMRVAVEEQSQAEYRQALLTKTQKILQVTREGPRAYQVDLPSGSSCRRVRYQDRV